MKDFLTIGIPVWRDPDSISHSVNAIVRSTAWRERTLQEKELIICVNGVNSKRDETLVAVRRLKKFVPELKILILKERGQNIAINHIARKSNPRTKSIFFCDADVLVKRKTIERVIDALNTQKGVMFAGAMATPATALVLEKNRSSFKAFFLKRHKERVKTEGNFISGAGWAVNKEFFLKNLLPPTSKIANDMYINTKFKGKIALVKNAGIYYLLPNPKDRLFQRARYVVQEKAQGVKQKSMKQTIPKMKLTIKEKRGLLINKGIDKLARGIVAINPNFNWKHLPSTKLKNRRR